MATRALATLKRKPIAGLSRKIAGLASKPAKLRRTPLNFVPEEKDALAGVKPGKTQEETLKRELDSVGKAFREASKKISEDQKHHFVGLGTEYFLMVFHDADQATAFLKAIGYPAPKDCFVDGPMVADLMGITLPKPLYEHKKLKTLRNPRLTDLAQPL